MAVRAVLLDVGETLVDETRHWQGWADWLGVPRLTFLGVLGGLIERGEHHRRVFELLAPGVDLERAGAERRAAGDPDGFDPADLYPDALPCLRALRAAGYRLALAGNTPLAVEGFLRAHVAEGDDDAIASSASLGHEKPDPAFFGALVERVGVAPAEAVYVGDRLDTDVRGAQAAGLRAVHLRRGPWGHLHALRPERAAADARLDGLAGLPALLARWA